MSNIKSFAKITENDITNLKTAVETIYANRNYLTNAGLIVPNLNNITVTQWGKIGSNLYTLLNSLLQLGDIDKVILNNQYYNIFEDGPINSDLITTLTVTNATKWETSDPKALPSQSCRGGCVGFCWNACNATCTYECKAQSSTHRGSSNTQGTSGTWCTETSCTGSCAGKCKTICYTECKQGCSGCQHKCGGSTCIAGCQGGCLSSCNNGAGIAA